MGIQALYTKLMQFIDLKPKFIFKSDSNHLLINFSDPIQAVRFNRRDDSIRIRTQILNPNSNYIENWSNIIQNGRKQPDYVIFNIIHRFQYNLSFSIK